MIGSKIMLPGLLAVIVTIQLYILSGIYLDNNKNSVNDATSSRETHVTDPSTKTETYSTPSIARFTEIVKRPLFNRTRRPEKPQTIVHLNPAVPVTPQPEQKIVKPNLVVMAIIITKDKKIALIKSPGKKSTVFRLTEGEKIAGWEIKSIEQGKVTIHNQGNEETLKLSDNVLTAAEKRQLAQAKRKKPSPRRKLIKPRRPKAIGKQAQRRSPSSSRSRTGSGSRRPTASQTR